MAGESIPGQSEDELSNLTITFPIIYCVQPSPLTGVATNASFVFQVMLPAVFQGGNIYAYPNVEAMRLSNGELRQYTSSAVLNGGFGIVRERFDKTTTLDTAPDTLNGRNVYPADWGFQANFGAKIPCNVNYCDEAGTIITELQTLQNIQNGAGHCYILFNPINDFSYTGQYNALIDSVLPYKTITR